MKLTIPQWLGAVAWVPDSLIASTWLLLFAFAPIAPAGLLKAIPSSIAVWLFGTTSGLAVSLVVAAILMACLVFLSLELAHSGRRFAAEIGDNRLWAYLFVMLALAELGFAATIKARFDQGLSSHPADDPVTLAVQGLFTAWLGAWLILFASIAQIPWDHANKLREKQA